VEQSRLAHFSRHLAVDEALNDERQVIEALVAEYRAIVESAEKTEP
jgi:hypothetical protein